MLRPEHPGEVRRRLRAVRRGIEQADAARRADAAADLLLALTEGRRSRRVGAYVAMDGELDPAPFLARFTAGSGGAGFVALPVVDDDRLRFVEVGPDTAMVTHDLGMAEPAGGATVALDSLDLLIVPAVAVDREGHRLGFGAGFYDRTLGDLAPDRRPLLVALVHPEQLVDAVEQHDGDVAVDAVVTPRELVWTPAAGTGAATRTTP